MKVLDELWADMTKRMFNALIAGIWMVPAASATSSLEMDRMDTLHIPTLIF